ncbi:hypothetical protein D3C85_801410 [compost metagenome]
MAIPGHHARFPPAVMPESGHGTAPSPCGPLFTPCLHPRLQAISRFYPPIRNLPRVLIGHLACPVRIRFRRAGQSFEGSRAPGRKNVDVIYIAIFAVMAGLTFALLRFCEALSVGEQP